jgi:PAS domain S-box-containing protein
MPQQRLTQHEFSRAIWRAVAPPLILLAAHAVLLSLLLLHWVNTGSWVQRSEQGIARIYDLERLLASMESGVRGFMLTGNDEFLEPYNLARARFNSALNEARALVSDNETQIQRLERIRLLYSQWAAFEPHRQMSTRAPRDPELVGVLEQRKQFMDRMRQALNEMILAEGQVRSDRFGRERNATITGIIGGIGVSISLGIALALINRRTVLNLSSAYQTALEEQAATGRQFTDLAETIPQLIWITDRDGRHVYFNKPWTTFTGIDSDKLVAGGWHSSLHPDDASAATEAWKKSFESGQPFEAQLRLIRSSDGTPRWFLCRAIPVRDQHGQLSRWFGTCTDIEDQKQAENHREQMLAAERRARSDLLRSARAKDEFLATLSHELRTPMTAILGWTRLLRDPAVRAKSLDRGIGVIESNAKVQARLIDDLLDMNRIMSGKLVLKPEMVDLRDVVRASIDSIMPAAHNKQIELVIHLDGPDPLVVSGDRGRLQQVVWNLLTNAVKFTPAGGKVTITLDRSGDTSTLTISDTGVGINAAFMPYLFERFRQADASVTREHGGLGLGLAIVRSLVEIHGGTVAVASDGENQGATFTVELPLARAGITSPVERAVAAQKEAEQIRLRGKRVLVVDDDADTGYVVAKALEMFGAVVTNVTSSAEAMTLLRDSEFDLLVSDIGMPGMDGYMLIRERRKIEEDGVRRLASVALTAFARAEDREAAIAAGFDLHVTKPIDAEDLASAALLALRLNS